MENEKFNLSKFAGSFFQGLPWIKTVRYAIGIAVLGVGILTVYRAWFKKDIQQVQHQTQAPVINQQPGSTVILQGPSQTVVEMKKKIEPFLFVVGGAHGGKNSETGWFTGVGAGLKF